MIRSESWDSMVKVFNELELMKRLVANSAIGFVNNVLSSSDAAVFHSAAAADTFKRDMQRCFTK